MRLDRFVATNSSFSRAEVRSLLKSGRICINGQMASDVSTKVTPEHDCVSVDGAFISESAPVFLMLNKPQGYVCANKDAEHPTVLDLIMQSANCSDQTPPKFTPADIQIAGRLDIDTTGLVLLTSDGQWNHRITSPSARAKKVYRVTLKDTLAPELVEKFKQGLDLKGEKHKTRPALLEIIDDRQARLSLSEGRYHQVKRMFAATGNHVVSLHRESVAGIVLDPDLPPGNFRALTYEELRLAHLASSGGLAEEDNEKFS